MIGIDQIVWFVFVAIIVVAVLALLWYAIGYAESKMPMPMAWNIVRLVFVLMVIFLLIAALRPGTRGILEILRLSLIGHPIVDFGGGGARR